MNRRFRFTIATAFAGAVTLSGAVVAPSIAAAQTYDQDSRYYYDCHDQRSDNTAAGALLGGAAGALLGGGVTGSAGGAIAGGAAGAAIGAGVGNSSTRCYDNRGYDYYRSPSYDNGYRYDNQDDYNNRAPDYYRNDGYNAPGNYDDGD